jgi:hypothetical protein
MATNHPTDRLPPVAIELAKLHTTGALTKFAMVGGLSPGVASLRWLDNVNTGIEANRRRVTDAMAVATKMSTQGAAIAAALEPTVSRYAALGAALAPPPGYQAALAMTRAPSAAQFASDRLAEVGVQIDAQRKRIRDTIAGAGAFRTDEAALAALTMPRTEYAPTEPPVDRTAELLAGVLETQHELVTIAESTETTAARRQRQMLTVVAIGIVLSTLLALASFILK